MHILGISIAVVILGLLGLYIIIQYKGHVSDFIKFQKALKRKDLYFSSTSKVKIIFIIHTILLILLIAVLGVKSIIYGIKEAFVSTNLWLCAIFFEGFTLNRNINNRNINNRKWMFFEEYFIVLFKKYEYKYSDISEVKIVASRKRDEVIFKFIFNEKKMKDIKMIVKKSEMNDIMNFLESKNISKVSSDLKANDSVVFSS